MQTLIRKMAVLLCACMLITAQHLHGQNSKEDPNLQAAFQAQGSLDLLKAKQLFEKVISNTKATKKDQCEALRELAVIELKFYNQYDKAKTLLYKADSIGDYRSETWLKLVRVEEEAKHYAKAMEAGQKAIALSKSEADKNFSKYRYAKTILTEAIAQLDLGQAYDVSKLNEALGILETLLGAQPTNVNAANVLLGVALLLEDGKRAMNAWLLAHRFADVESAYEYLKPAAEQLNEVLPNWKAPLQQSQQEQIIAGLGASRFYEYARIAAKLFNLNKAEASMDANHSIAYANYINAIRIITNDYYRAVSIGGQQLSRAFINDLRSKNVALYKELTANDKQRKAFDLNTFRALIRSKFGSVYLISSTSTSRVTGLVFGHVVNERIRNIEQYGHSADFTFTELDKIISNGYPSWFWEDRGAGGYAITGGFIRIKSMFNHLAIDAWERVTDTVIRSKIEKSIKDNLYASNLDTDIKVIRSAVAKQIELDALDALYQQLVADGLKGLELQLKFIEYYERYRDNATMFAHEGRHSIDRVVLGNKYGALGSKQVEYRGRLSQIAFSASPKLELANMLNGVSSSPSGQSNQMILDVLESWINDNKTSIPNYDSNMQAIAQLYKLTDIQIINCIKTVDPFYIAYNKK